MNDLELEREIRATFQRRGADVLDPAAVPPAHEVLRRTRRHQLTNIVTFVVVTVTLVGASVAGVSALIRSSERRIPIGPSETPSPTAIVGFACPAGSTPDQPGPVDQVRPPKDDHAYVSAATAFDPRSGAMLLLPAEGTSWTFDICTNTWEARPGPDIGSGASELVFDVDSELAIAFDRTARVWTYDPGGATWAQIGGIGPGTVAASWEPLQAVYDPVTGFVVVRDQFRSTMWTYDVDSDTWTEVDQGPMLPPAVEGGTSDTAVELLSYDASVDRLVLYVTRPLSTWEFDPRAGRWSEQETDTPANPGFGWIATGEELAYDEANGVSVLFSGGTLATYDASEHRWTVLTGGRGIEAPAAGEAPRLYFAMTYDSVNERTVVAGGDIRTGYTRWRPVDDAIAFDVATGAWSTLLEPTEAGA